MSEIVFELAIITSFECDANGVPKGIFGSCCKLVRDGLDLGEELLDRIEIGALGRHVEN